MNNKGQSLVVFVIIIPIILILFTIVINLGFVYVEKRAINNTLDNAIEYYNENKEDIDIENKIRLLINKNIDNIDKLDIEINNNQIQIELTKKEIKVMKKG